MTARRHEGTKAVALLALALLVPACAARNTMPAAPGVARYPEFVYPALVAPDLGSEGEYIERGWRYLQTDNQRSAEREFAAALKQQPASSAALSGLAYVQLARKDATEAISLFDRALATTASYSPALVGRGLALLEGDDEAAALASFEAAVKSDPSLGELRSRIDVLRVRALQDNLARAKAASDAGRLDEARTAYTRALQASPDSAFLHRDLAQVERKAGQPGVALEHFRRAVALDSSDARSLAAIGEILEAQGDLPGAIASYESARVIDPGEVALERLTKVRDAAALATMPAEFRAIPTAPVATRGDVAALLGVRLAGTVANARARQSVVTDVRTHWARDWITTVVRAGIMDTQPNYTFQPGTGVRRGDLAQTVARVLALVATSRPQTAARWQRNSPPVTDVPATHLSYPAVATAVAAGVMPLDPDGTFQLLRPVTGSELVDVVTRLEALAR